MTLLGSALNVSGVRRLLSPTSDHAFCLCQSSPSASSRVAFQIVSISLRQCDQMASLFFNIWQLTRMEICPLA